MGFLKNLFGGGSRKHEDKGDELRLDLMYRDAAFYYQKALDLVEEGDNVSLGRLTTKLREVRRKAVADLIDEAETLLEDGDGPLAEERLTTALSFADDPAARTEVERRLEAIQGGRGTAAPPPETEDVPVEVAGTDDDLFDLALSGLEPADQDRARELGDAFRLGYEACQREAWGEALDYFTGLSEAKADDPLVHEMIALCRDGQGDVSGALAAYRESLDLDPTRPGSVQGLVTALRRTGEIDEAREVLAASVRHRSADGGLSEPWIEIHMDHATSLAETGRVDEAVEALLPLRQEPNINLGLLYFNLAGVLEAADRETEARGALEKAIETAPRVSLYRERLSDFLVKRGRELDQALKLIVEANEVETTAAAGMFGGGGGKATVSPHRARYLYKMARIQFLQGKDGEAERTVEAALAVSTDPQVTEALESLQQDLRESGSPKG